MLLLLLERRDRHRFMRNLLAGGGAESLGVLGIYGVNNH
jgi:hypothetical protein